MTSSVDPPDFLLDFPFGFRIWYFFIFCLFRADERIVDCCCAWESQGLETVWNMLRFVHHTDLVFWLYVDFTAGDFTPLCLENSAAITCY